MPGLETAGATAMKPRVSLSAGRRAWAWPVSTCSRRDSSRVTFISPTELMVCWSHDLFFFRGSHRNVADRLCLMKAKGLEQVTTEKTAQVMQVTSDNPMVGLEGRASLLVNLSHALQSNPTFFGAEGRPGNLIGNVHVFALCPAPGASIPSACLTL